MQRACDEPAERRLAGSRRSHDSEHLTGRERKADALQHSLVRACRNVGHVLDVEIAGRSRKLHHFWPYGHRGHELLQPPEGDARSCKGLPGADRVLDRTKTAAQKDRARKDGGRAEVPVHDEPGGRGHHEDLREQAQEARNRLHLGGSETRLRLALGRFLVILSQLTGNAGKHAHGRNCLGVPEESIKPVLAACRSQGGKRQRPVGQPLVKERAKEHDQAAGNGDPADQWMDQHQRYEEYRRPGRVEQRADCAARKEAPDGCRVAPRLRGAGRVIAAGSSDRAVDQPGLDAVVQPFADAAQQFLPYGFQHRVNGESQDDDQRQHQKRVHAAAGNDVVIDLQQVERQRETK